MYFRGGDPSDTNSLSPRTTNKRPVRKSRFRTEEWVGVGIVSFSKELHSRPPHTSYVEIGGSLVVTLNIRNRRSQCCWSSSRGEIWGPLTLSLLGPVHYTFSTVPPLNLGPDGQRLSSLNVHVQPTYDPPSSEYEDRRTEEQTGRRWGS